MSFFYNLLTDAGSRYYIIPSEFSWFTNQIWRQGDELFTDFDFDAIPNSLTGTEKWVDPVLGSNANNGNSSSTPYATIQYAYQQGGRQIHLKSGSVFTYIQGFQTTRPTQNTKIDVYDGDDDVYLTTALAMVYTQNGTFPVVYQATSSEPARTINIVFDLTYKDINGSDIAYILRTTIADVAAQPASFYYDSTADTLYVRTWNDRVPDASLYACLDNLAAIPLNNAADTSTIYCENIRFIGGRACDVNSTTGRTVSFRNCRATGVNTNGGFFIQDNVSAIFYHCRADYNRTDGFNYQGTAKGLEWFCGGIQNGRDNASEANNGSTGHANTSVISVSGDYQYSRGKAIQHIGNAKCLYIRPLAGNSLVISPVDDDTSGYATDSTQPGNTIMWIYEGRFVGNALSPRFWNFATSIMNVYDGPFGNVLTGPNRQDPGSILNVLTEQDVYQ
jgi:hypothetical protein